MLQKRAAAIHDISCFGKCSLTVALPVLSAAGIETMHPYMTYGVNFEVELPSLMKELGLK